MNWISPNSGQIIPESGRVENSNGSYQKRFRDLEGLYEDADAFQQMLPEWSDQVFM